MTSTGRHAVQQLSNHTYPHFASLNYEGSRPSLQAVKAQMADFNIIATNGAMPAPTRASPGPMIPNGKAREPVQMEMPQSVASTDPKIAAQQASDMRNIVRRKLTGYVGFANLPNQWHRKSVRKGFNFNVMVVGKCHCDIDSPGIY
jgi:hypothetical protein